ncbi:MAG TPA: class I tRNA ligase family protein [Chitinophagales bacterium]|nr:class I tRNA ligase family protein [Chitinophagales bacterium]
MGNARPLAEQATPEELKVLHKTIKRVNEDIERLAFNTCVSSFMIGVNELSKMKSLAAATLLELNKLIAPFAPHTAEALWTLQQQSGSVVDVPFPQHDEQYLVESAFNYPIQINGKHRANIELPLDMPQDEIQRIVLSDERVVKFTEGNAPKKFIVVPGRIINVVV